MSLLITSSLSFAVEPDDQWGDGGSIYAGDDVRICFYLQDCFPEPDRSYQVTISYVGYGPFFGTSIREETFDLPAVDGDGAAELCVRRTIYFDFGATTIYAFVEGEELSQQEVTIEPSVNPVEFRFQVNCESIDEIY